MILKHRKIKVILFCDSFNKLNSLEILLKKEEHEVYVCHRYKDYIVILGQVVIDVILLDLDMANGSGIRFLNAVKNNKIMSKIPIVIITLDKKSSSFSQALNLGATEFIIKSFDNVKIKEKLTYFTSYLTLSDMQMIIKKVCLSDPTSFVGPGAFVSLQEKYDCYPILFDLDEKKGNLLIKKEMSIKKMKTATDQVIEDSSILYLKSSLRWFPIWPNRKYEPTWEENINELVEIDIKI
jgi:CheY-like chemotaxis protein